jgi:hypothetical protein
MATFYFSRLAASKASASRWLVGLAAAVAFGVALPYAFYTVFSRSLSLDEGFVMITVQSLLQGQPLYDSVFTQYGPACYIYKWTIHSALGVPLTHDATRLLCMLHWLMASSVVGLAAGQMTRSALAAVFAFMQTIVHLAQLANEPGHPQELAALLLGAAFLIGSRGVDRRNSVAALAFIAAALFFIKINVGIFFAIALGLTIAWHASDRFSRGTAAWLLIAGCAVVPFVLMRRHLMQDWCRNYALLVVTSLLAVSLTAKEVIAKCHSAGGPWRVMMAATAATTTVVVAITLIAGTSLRGLINGVLISPLRMFDAALWPLVVPDFGLLNAGVSLLFAVFAALNVSHPRRPLIINTAKALFGIAGSVLFIAEVGTQLKYLLPWVWLILVAGKDGPPAASRTFLALMAVWQALQAYPIAGTQIAIATLPLVAAFTVCLVDALRAVRLPPRIRHGFWSWRLNPHLAGEAAAVLLLIGVFGFVWWELFAVRRYYRSLPALDLPGSKFVRTDAATTKVYQTLTHYLQANCDTFITAPGMNSFYFWTGKRPPTHINSTTLSVLSHRQEEEVLKALRRAKRPIIVAAEGLSSYLPRDASVPARPLLRALRDEYMEVDRVGSFKIYVRRSEAPRI